jgi:hypothetical protein
MIRKPWHNLIMGTIKKVNDLHTKLTHFSSCSTILELAFAANEVCAMLAMNGRHLHSRKALSGDVAHPQHQHQAGACGALDASPARLPIHGERPQEPLPAGPPDIVLPKYRTVIFVNGCFWHGHEHCPNFRMPKSRRAFWKKKIEGNIARDAVNEMKLRKLGWHVVTVWECDLHNSITKKHLMKRLPVLLKN